MPVKASVRVLSIDSLIPGALSGARNISSACKIEESDAKFRKVRSVFFAKMNAKV